MLSDRGARIVAQVGYPVRFHLQPDFLMQLSNKAFAEALVPFVQTPKKSPSDRVEGRLLVAQVEQDLPRLRIEQKSACPELRSALDELYVRHSPILLRRFLQGGTFQHAARGGGYFLAQRFQHQRLVVTIEQIERFERNEATIRLRDVNTGLLE